jgi:hypothetical protein
MQEEPSENLLSLLNFMNISITLDTEQTAALDELLADYNATLVTPVTAEDYLQAVLIGAVNDKVAQRFEATASSLVEAARQLSYEDRLALIAQVEAAVNP